jgi:MoxR-like ATPase
MVEYIQQENEFDYFKKCVEDAPEGKTFGMLFIGPPGTGKTLCAMNLPHRFDAPYHVIDGSPQLDRRDLEGCWEMINGQTEFNKGPLIKSLEDANNTGLSFLVFNEPNAVLPSEQISFNALMTENHLNLISKAGERVELEPEAKLIVIGTINLNVLGINELQEAFDDRFLINYEFHYPTKHKEIEIITTVAGCNEDCAALLVELAEHLRKAVNDLTLGKVFSTRHACNFANLVWKMKVRFLRENIRAMIINKISKDEKQKEFISGILDGINFKRRLWEIVRDQ